MSPSGSRKSGLNSLISDMLYVYIYLDIFSNWYLLYLIPLVLLYVIVAEATNS